MHDLDPSVVDANLRILAELYVAETVEEGIARLRAEATSPEAFAGAVARRLEELRAIYDLGMYLGGKART